MAGGGIFAKKLQQAKKQAESLKGKTLEVGFFSGSRYEDGTSVADVAYWNEFGRPENNQPPRPFFRNAISEHKTEWADSFKSKIENNIPIETTLEALGTEIINDIRTSIRDLKEPPLATSTIKSKISKKSKHPDNPLLDTEFMWKEVRSVVKNGN